MSGRPEEQSARSTSESPPIARLGRYSITKTLGHGGMGVVYLAERDDVGGLVAIKVLTDAWVSAEHRERFASEQRMLAQLSHRSIARLYDAHTLPDGTPWFAMEYVEGVPLDVFCGTHQSPLSDRLRLFRDVCEAVLYAHRHLLIHRDLKPSNVLVTTDGAIKLLDFGIAKQLDAAEAAGDQTRTGFRFLTPAYAAPDQLRGAPADVQTDVYALGVTLYELLAGQRPFELSNRTPREAETILSEQEPAKPSLVSWTSSTGARSVSGAAWADLDALCLTAMHKDPQRRYASVEALIREIDHFLAGEPLEARADSLWYRANKFARRHWRGVAAAILAIAIIGGLIGFYTVRLIEARNAALTEAARALRIQEFMLELFDGGEQEAASANDLRVVTLVERGVKDVQSLASDPAVQAELRETLGGLYQRLGKFDEAERLLRTALAQRRALHGGTDHPETASAMTILAQGLLLQGKYAEATELLRGALAIYRATYDDTHHRVAVAVSDLGSVFLARGEYEEAERLLREAVALHTETLSASHMNTAISRIKLGRALSRQRRYHEAEAHLREGHEILTKQTQPSVSWLRTAREELVTVYDALEQPENVQKFRAELGANR